MPACCWRAFPANKIMPQNSFETSVPKITIENGLTEHVLIGENLYWFETGILTRKTVDFPAAPVLTGGDTNTSYVTLFVTAADKVAKKVTQIEIYQAADPAEWATWTWVYTHTFVADETETGAIVIPDLAAATDYYFKARSLGEAGAGGYSSVLHLATTGGGGGGGVSETMIITDAGLAAVNDTYTRDDTLAAANGYTYGWFSAGGDFFGTGGTKIGILLKSGVSWVATLDAGYYHSETTATDPTTISDWAAWAGTATPVPTITAG